ncbi:MAG: HAD-IB family hydrolase [Alphaproteobacteria bacterium]|nr:HAD-IB family hydrolase [Alphaproteobacteria bacterium]
MNGVAFFDLDRTLLDVNSGTLWLRHEWRQGRLGLPDAVRATWWLTRYALGHGDLDHALAHAASVYAGDPEAEIRQRVEAWFAERIAGRLRPGAVEALAHHRTRGDVLVLASTSSQYAARCAMRLYGLDDAVSTELEAQDGRLTGRLAASGFGAAKLARCAAWAEAHGVALADTTFYTDSYTDLPLLEQVGHPVVVCPDRRLAREAVRRGWPVQDWGRAA